MSRRHERMLATLKEIARSQGGELLTDRYVDLNTRMRWRCEKGHTWETLAVGVRRGSWCPKCAGRARRTIEEMQELAAKNGGKCLSKRYEGTLTKLRWRCAKGHEWLSTPNTLLGGCWCPTCRRGKGSVEEMQELAAARGGEYLATVYEGVSTPALWRCGKGHEWKARPAHVKRGSWCPRCAGRKRTIADMRELAAKRGGKCLSKRYVNSSTKLTWQCDKGHVFESPPTYVASGNWCSSCSRTRRGTIEAMRATAEARGGKCLSKRYVNSSTKLTWQCAHGHKWRATPGHVKNTSWCPKCAGHTTLAEMRRLAADLGGRCLSRSYSTSRTKLRFRCGEGHVLELMPIQLRSGVFCHICGPAPFSVAAMRAIAKTRGGKCLSRGAGSSHAQVRMRCREGHEWSATADRFHRGHWCPTCAGRDRSLDDMRELAEERGGECLSVEYVDAMSKLLWRCSRGHEFEARSTSVKNGRWCLDCEGLEG